MNVCEKSSLENLIAQEASKDSRYKKINKKSSSWAFCCMLTTIGISAIAGGAIAAGCAYYQLVYGYGYTETTWDIVVGCALTGTVGATAGGLGGGFASWCLCSEAFGLIPN